MDNTYVPKAIMGALTYSPECLGSHFNEIRLGLPYDASTNVFSIVVMGGGVLQNALHNCRRNIPGLATNRQIELYCLRSTRLSSTRTTKVHNGPHLPSTPWLPQAKI